MPQTFNVGSRSLFITVTAWAFILLGLMATVSAVVQQATLAGMTPGWALQLSAPLPAWVQLLAGYLPWFVGAGMLLSIALLAAAIGLLYRLEWARRVFIGLLLLAIAANLAGLWLQQEVMVSLVDATLGRSALPPQVAGVFGGFVTAARTMAAVVTLVGCALMAWIVRRLMSTSARQEFA